MISSPPTAFAGLMAAAATMRAQGQFQKALNYYQAALKTGHSEFATYLEMGDTILAQHNPALYPLSLACYRQSLQLHPENPTAYHKLGELHKKLGQTQAAVAALQKALQLDPNLIDVRFTLLDVVCPLLYETEEDVVASRAAYSRLLNELEATLDLRDQDAIDRAAKAVGIYPFHLAYQGYNDIDLQRCYGQLLGRIQTAKYPQWSRPLLSPPQKEGEPLRVGIASGFFRKHATWNFPTRGLLEAMDRKRFALYGYHLGRESDLYTDFARQAFDHFVEQDFSLVSLCHKILEDKLHVLLYPEIGMNRLGVRLSSLRLAPVQCASWGHSTTSGLPTIDYFLSSDLMEPADGASHYTETLIRLPNLSVYYLPQESEPAVLQRADLGLKREAVLYLCVQNLTKYLPQYDAVFPLIAKATENCQFVFLARRKSTSVVNLFRRRLAGAFAQHGLNSDNYTVFLSDLDDQAYFNLHRVADVSLDSIGWSGCNTTMDAVACNLPVVTLPGHLMRGRQSFAILKMMGLMETVADSVDDYVQIAARLGTDTGWRKQIQAQVAANKHKLYRDLAPIKQLEAFLEDAVAEARRQWRP